MKEYSKVLSLVVGVGPWQVLPLLIAKRKRYLRVDPIPEINAVFTIFGRRENQLSHRHIAWVDVKRSLDVEWDILRDVAFPIMRHQLVRRQFRGIVPIRKNRKLLL